MPANKKINLLPQEDFERSGVGHVLTWLLSSFRVFVTFTEIIVISAFLSRFWLDVKSNDLDDAIRQRSALITANLPFEKQFKDTQERLKIFSSLSKNKSATDTINLVGSFLPTDVKLVNVSVEGSDVTLTGTSASEFSILQFLTNLAASSNFDKPVLSALSTNPQDPNTLTFSIKTKTN